MNPRLVIFDCDGTLVDSQNAICAAMEYAFTTLELPPPSRAEILAVVGLSLPQAFAVLAAAHPPSVRAALAEHYRSGFPGKGHAGVPDPLYPGIGAAVTELARRDDILLGIATGKSRRGVTRILAREGWHGHFVTIQTADDNPSKPHPSMILRAMAETGAGPAATVMVGDSTYDIEMARNAGVGAVGVAWGYQAPERLRLAGAHRIAAECATLVATIEAQFDAQAARLESEEAGA